MKKLLLLVALSIILLAVAQKTKLVPQIDLEKKLGITSSSSPKFEKETIVYQESVVTKVVETAAPSVVTVGINKTTSGGDFFEFDPFDYFSPFRQLPQAKRKIEQNIGSGFIIGKNGLIITNKHVVSDTNAKYKILTHDNKKFDVEKIYRDPLNDLAILKINTDNLQPLALGDSSRLKLGQMAIAIGTPLGEFKNTVTVGIVSGLGRGITAGSPFEGFVEKLDNVIQTDAAISPGNSGGPLLNSKGEAIGVNTAIAQEGQNIGFAIPVNVVKELIENFKKNGGSFERPYIGVRYKMIDKQTAILNDIVEGAYIVEVIADSPAEDAQLQEEDIIVEFDGQKVKGDDEQGLAKMISAKKIGETVKVKIWRDKSLLDKNLTFAAFKE